MKGARDALPTPAEYTPPGPLDEQRRCRRDERAMKSLFDDLDEKIARDPSLRKRSMPRVDLSMLLFNARGDLRTLWDSAQQVVAGARSEGRAPREALVHAVEKLRPIFGERGPHAR